MTTDSDERLHFPHRKSAMPALTGAETSADGKLNALAKPALAWLVV